MPKSRKQQTVEMVLQDTLATLTAEDRANADSLRKAAGLFEAAVKRRAAGLKSVAALQNKAANLIAESLRLAEEIEAEYARATRVHVDVLGQVIEDLSDGDDDAHAPPPIAQVHAIATRSRAPQQ